MTASHWYAQLVRPVTCPNCGAQMPADRSDDIAPFLWHVERDGAAWSPDSASAGDGRFELLGECSRCRGEVTYRVPADVHLVEQPSPPSAAGTPALRIRGSA